MIFLSILEQTLIALPLIVGAYITLSLLKLPDFSIESAYLLGAVAAYMTSGFPLPLIIAFAAAGGMFVGGVVCLLNQFLNIPFLLAAIVVNGLFHGTAQYILGTSIKSLHVNLPFNEIVQLVLIASLLLSCMFILLRSQLGYALAIYGNNRKRQNRSILSEMNKLIIAGFSATDREGAHRAFANYVTLSGA